MNDETDAGHDASPQDEGPYPHLKAFLLGKGIARHKQTAEIAGLLGLAKTSIFRKFKGESSFTLPELKAIADHFGTDVDTLRGQAPAVGNARSASLGEMQAARLRIPGLPSQGELIAGPLLDGDDVCDLVAVKRETIWEVFAWGAPELKGLPLHSIERLQLRSTPRHRVAVLEDDANAAALVGMALEGEGMTVHTYQEPGDLITALGQRQYHAYVIDWLLGGSTAESAIREIRTRQPAAPIVITTGAMHTGAETEGALIPFAERHGAGIFEKPFRQAVLASYLRRGIATAGSPPR
jgi:CheY-like chemotaxis protein